MTFGSCRKVPDVFVITSEARDPFSFPVEGIGSRTPVRAASESRSLAPKDSARDDNQKTCRVATAQLKLHPFTLNETFSTNIASE
jgi:hypothetical protein